MKSTVKLGVNTRNTYPALYKNTATGVIILAITEQKGTVLHSGWSSTSLYGIGDRLWGAQATWDSEPSVWNRLTGPVSIEFTP